jgi:serine/threonine protein kinase
MRFTLVNEDEILVGSVVAGRYHVSEVLGQGTTGTVFGVEHVGFGRRSAMKVLRPRYATADLIHRVFQGEARAAFLTSHPCLVEVFDVGVLPDGSPYMVMERLEGETLAARILRERLSTGAAVDVVMQLLSAVDALHQRELLLRGLHPQNVLLAGRRGCRPIVKLLDVGLARLVPLEKVEEEWDTIRAIEGAADGAGSLAVPYYVPPERTRGEHVVERASDLFVAAAIFYEALTGRKPFEAATWTGLLRQIAQGNAPRICDARDDLPPELDALMARALSPNPRTRPQSARDLQEEIRAVFDGARGTTTGVTRERGSTSLRAAVPVAVPPPPLPIPVVITDDDGRDVDEEEVTNSTPLAAVPPEAAAVAATLVRADLYEEETRADHDRDALLAMHDRLNAEASAENPHRTIPPPHAGSIDVVIDDDPNTMVPVTTSRGDDMEAAIAKLHREDEETETMQLTPELRERIEQMTRSAAQPSSQTIEQPPETRRLGKPE